MNIGIEETVKCCVNRYTLNLFFVSSHQLSYATKNPISVHCQHIQCLWCYGKVVPYGDVVLPDMTLRLHRSKTSKTNSSSAK